MEGPLYARRRFYQAALTPGQESDKLLGKTEPVSEKG
jgi:hypothetical protein